MTLSNSLFEVKAARRRGPTSFPEKGCFTPRAHPVVVVVFRHNSRILSCIESIFDAAHVAISSGRLLQVQFALQFKSSFLCVRPKFVHRPCWCAIGFSSQIEPKVSWSL